VTVHPLGVAQRPGPRTLSSIPVEAQGGSLDSHDAAGADASPGALGPGRPAPAKWPRRSASAGEHDPPAPGPSDPAQSAENGEMRKGPAVRSSLSAGP